MGALFELDYQRGGPLPQPKSLRVVVLRSDTGEAVAESYPVTVFYHVNWLVIEPHIGTTELRSQIGLTNSVHSLKEGQYTTQIEAVFPGTKVLTDSSQVILHVKD